MVMPDPYRHPLGNIRLYNGHQDLSYKASVRHKISSGEWKKSDVICVEPWRIPNTILQFYNYMSRRIGYDTTAHKKQIIFLVNALIS